MQYFTNRFQGNVPILANHPVEAFVIVKSSTACIIQRFMCCIYGGREWQIQPVDPNNEYKNFIICR